MSWRNDHWGREQREQERQRLLAKRERLLSKEEQQNFLRAKEKTEETIREETLQDILSETTEEWLTHQLIGHLNHDGTEVYRAGLVARTIITKIKQAAEESKKDNDE